MLILPEKAIISDTLQEYAELTTKEAAELAVKFERHTAADGCIVIPAKVVKNIQVFCFWARERVCSGQQLIAADFTAQALLEAKESMWLREENKQEALTIKPDKFNPMNWTEWSKHFVTYLITHKRSPICTAQLCGQGGPSTRSIGRHDAMQSGAL